MSLTFLEVSQIVLNTTGKAIKNVKPVVLSSQDLFQLTSLTEIPNKVYFGDLTIRTDLRAYFIVHTNTGTKWMFSHNSDEGIQNTTDTAYYRNVLFDSYNVPEEQANLNADHILLFTGYEIEML